jgi:hypothetical protein
MRVAQSHSNVRPPEDFSQGQLFREAFELIKLKLTSTTQAGAESADLCEVSASLHIAPLPAFVPAGIFKKPAAIFADAQAQP